MNWHGRGTLNLVSEVATGLAIPTKSGACDPAPSQADAGRSQPRRRRVQDLPEHQVATWALLKAELPDSPGDGYPLVITISGPIG